MPHTLPPNDRPQLHTVLTVPVAGGPAPLRAAPAPFDEPMPEPLDWHRVMAALGRRKWLIAGIILLGAIGGFAATRVIDPTYVAQATIWIDPRARSESGPVPFQGARLLDPEAWTDLMRSYAVLDDVARTQRLYLRVDPSDPPAATAGLAVADSFRPGVFTLVADAEGASYRLEDQDGTELDRAPAGRPIGAAFGLQWTPPAGALPPNGAASFELVTLRDASAALAEQLQLHIDPEGNLLRLELEGTDRARLAALLNAVAERYVAVAGELKRQKVSELTTILAAQLATATRDLTRAESTYQAFRVRTITLPTERAPSGTVESGATAEAAPAPVIGRYLDLQVAHADVRRDRAAIERALSDVGPAGISVEALNAVGAVRVSPTLAPALAELTVQETQLRQLRSRYTEDHPEVLAVADRVRTLRTRTIPNLAQALASELRERESLSGREVTMSAASLRLIPARSLEEARLRRNVVLAEGLHNTLQQRHEEAQMAEVSSIPDARILDRAAVPQHPVRDTSLRLILLALGGSLVLGLGAALFLDRVDPRFRYPAQVLRELKLPILGALPHFRGTTTATAADHAGPEREALVEAIRGLRMALLNEVGTDGPLVLAVSSPGSGDGKSFVAASLAQSFAEAGFSTLVIDGDLRRGRLHQRFARGRRPGLVDVLKREVPLDAALQATDVPGLSILSGGSRIHHAPELLAGPGLGSVVGALRDRYEVVVCDTPPLTAGVDPYLLSVAAGRLLVVLRAGVSHREMMAAKLAVLTRMPIQLLGVVMNDVPTDDGYGYYSYHLSGYETHDERVTVPAVTAGG